MDVDMKEKISTKKETVKGDLCDSKIGSASSSSASTPREMRENIGGTMSDPPSLQERDYRTGSLGSHGSPSLARSSCSRPARYSPHGRRDLARELKIGMRLDWYRNFSRGRSGGFWGKPAACDCRQYGQVHRCRRIGPQAVSRMRTLLPRSMLFTARFSPSAFSAVSIA